MTRERPSPDREKYETETPKQRKSDSASQKAKTLSSGEDEHDASEKANTSHAST